MTTISLNKPAAFRKGTRTNLLSSTFSKVQNYFRLRQRQRINRQAFAHMLTLDDAMLRDIGVTRADIHWANSLPLSENAAVELKKVSLRNRSRN